MKDVEETILGSLKERYTRAKMYHTVSMQELNFLFGIIEKESEANKEKTQKIRHLQKQLDNVQGALLKPATMVNQMVS